MSSRGHDLPRMIDDVFCAIYLIRDVSQVIGIAASADATAMVNLHALWDWPNVSLVNIPMHFDDLAIKSHRTIATVATFTDVAAKDSARTFESWNRTWHLIVFDPWWRVLRAASRIKRSQCFASLLLAAMPFAEAEA